MITGPAVPGDGMARVIDAASVGGIPGIWKTIDAASAVLVLAHGAGAGMNHAFMRALSDALAGEDVATLRYEFPYMTARKRRPDPPRVLHACVRAACEHARSLAGDRPLFAGGKSMGGRMTSEAQAEAPMPGLRGLVFVGFPLHPAGTPATSRATHLAAIAEPMLFLQGTRDALAERALMQDVCAGLGTRATLHEIDGADHAFIVRSRAAPERHAPPPLAGGSVQAHLALTIARWMRATTARR